VGAKRARRVVTALAIVAGVAALIALAMAPPAEPTSTPPVIADVGSKPPQDAARIAYPEGQEPKLRLPGGRQETVRSVLNIDYPLQFGSYVWDDAGVPAGPVWVRVDIAKQLISVFRDGHEIGSAVILYGAESKPTPSGAFTVLQKARDYHSRTYDAPMPFMLRLTADGVAIHASNVREGWATHGCIGVPEAFAQRLFSEMKLGDTVFIEA
jgi:lipoprotein-anchoring transpeptidase ErfK/SrfK